MQEENMKKTTVILPTEVKIFSLSSKECIFFVYGYLILFLELKKVEHSRMQIFCYSLSIGLYDLVWNSQVYYICNLKIASLY